MISVSDATKNHMPSRGARFGVYYTLAMYTASFTVSWVALTKGGVALYIFPALFLIASGLLFRTLAVQAPAPALEPTPAELLDAPDFSTLPDNHPGFARLWADIRGDQEWAALMDVVEGPL